MKSKVTLSTPSNGQNKYYISVSSGDKNLIEMPISNSFCHLICVSTNISQLTHTHINKKTNKQVVFFKYRWISNDRMNAFGAWDSSETFSSLVPLFNLLAKPSRIFRARTPGWSRWMLKIGCQAFGQKVTVSSALTRKTLVV